MFVPLLLLLWRNLQGLMMLLRTNGGYGCRRFGAQSGDFDRSERRDSRAWCINDPVGGCLYRTWEAGYSSFTKMPPVMVSHSSFGRIKMPWGHPRQCIFLDFSRVRIFTMRNLIWLNKRMTSIFKSGVE